MALQTICDSCESLWLVDQLVFVEALENNLCPVCINNLVDLLVSECSEATWQAVKNAMNEA